MQILCLHSLIIITLQRPKQPEVSDVSFERLFTNEHLVGVDVSVHPPIVKGRHGVRPLRLLNGLGLRGLTNWGSLWQEVRAWFR